MPELNLSQLCEGIPSPLPSPKQRSNKIPHAPYRNSRLSAAEKKVFHQQKNLNFYINIYNICLDSYQKCFKVFPSM